MESVPTIAVKTPSANYPVVIGRGLLGGLASRIAKLTPGKHPRVFILTSPPVWGLWGRKLTSTFADAPTVLFIPAGETHKRMRTVERLCEELATAGADRDSLLIAFGGGIVGDITGFVAAIYMRGVRYVQVPSTLLAQVDSSVGGKTGVNLARGKNLVGAFNHPLAVFADIDLLGTLPARELRAGLQESVKAGVIRDARLFAYMEKNAAAILRGEPEALEHVVAASVRMKATVVGLDERESGLRMILNYGHTVGHAIEAATGYKKLLHGEAIGWGMIAALHIAYCTHAMRRASRRASSPTARFRCSAHKRRSSPRSPAATRRIAAAWRALCCPRRLARPRRSLTSHPRSCCRASLRCSP